MNKTGTRKIETERLILRRFVIEDADDMFNGWCNDPEVSKYLTWPPHGSVEVTKSLLNAWIPAYDKGDYGTLRQAGLNMQGICVSVCYSVIRSDREKQPGIS